MTKNVQYTTTDSGAKLSRIYSAYNSGIFLTSAFSREQ